MGYEGKIGEIEEIRSEKSLSFAPLSSLAA
jgi:hypothetical protein